MQKAALTKALMLALMAWGTTGVALAQSSLTLYGNLDVALDNVHKGQGDVSGTIYSTSTSLSAPSTLTRVTSSVSSVNAIGVRGTEDMGGGYKSNFVLEGQMQLDTGAQVVKTTACGAVRPMWA